MKWSVNLKDKFYDKTELDSKFDALVGFTTIVVNVLPTTGKSSTMYLLPSDESTESNNIYDEYIWVNNKFEKIGSTKTTIDLSEYVKQTEMNTQLANKANVSHTHSISNVTNLQTTLNGKANANHSHDSASSSANGFLSKEDKSKLDGIATGANKTVVDSSLSSSSTNPVQNKIVTNALNGKANSSHSHSISNITNLQSSLDGKSPTSHTHDDRYYTESEMNTKLNGKANSSHSHSISNITNLQSALDSKSATGHNHDERYYTETEMNKKLNGKADSSHTHSIRDVTNLQSKLDTIPSLTSTSIPVSGTDNQGTITFYKFGKIVVMELNLSKVHLTHTWNVVGIVPNGYMPKLADAAGAPMVFWSVQGQQGQSAQLNIKPTGEIRFAYGNGETPPLGTYVTYIVD